MVFLLLPYKSNHSMLLPKAASYHFEEYFNLQRSFFTCLSRKEAKRLLERFRRSLTTAGTSSGVFSAVLPSGRLTW
jgi:hypothetical protein